MSLREDATSLITEFLEKAGDWTFMGVPLPELSRDELLAVAAFACEQQQREMERSMHADRKRIERIYGKPST